MTDMVSKVFRNRYNKTIILFLDSFKYDGRDTLTIDFDNLPTAYREELKFSVLHVQSKDSGIVKRFKYSNTDTHITVGVVYHEFVECDGGKFLIKVAESIVSNYAKNYMSTFNTNSYKGPR